MTTLKDYEPGSVKVMLLGPSGSGKTCLATTLGKRAVVLDLNNGLASAKTFKDKWTNDRALCEVKKCWGEGGPEAMWRRTVGYVRSFIASPQRPALVIDGLSDLLEASLGAVLTMSGKWVDTNPKNSTQAEWGQAISQIERLLWKIKSSSTMVVFIAHTKLIEKDGLQKEVLGCYGTTLPGKITAMFDEVWYTKVSGFGNKRSWSLQSQSSAGVECKTRRQLPEGTDMNLGMDKLLELVDWKWKDKEPKAADIGQK